jgi:hypothetical protein
MRAASLREMIHPPIFMKIICLLLGCILTSVWPVHGQTASVVKIRGDNGRYWIERNGTPFFVKGAVGYDRLIYLRDCGANSVRTGANNLDNAGKNDLTVLTGLPFTGPRHGFDYTNVDKVAAQLDRARATVRKYKDHPAVLFWAIGNEMEINTTQQQRVLVWKAVNQMAEMIHQEDANHPVITVIGGQYKEILHELADECPALDAIGLNAYADMMTLPEDVKREGWTKAYLVTEFGPRGHWQVKKTPWRLPIEDSSSEKAEFYLNAYEHAVADQPQCLGSYAFYWASKQEKTHTWYGMFLPDGSPTESIDVMTKVWTGEWPANRCPHVGPGKIEAIPKDSPLPKRPGVFREGAVLHCRFDVADPESGPMKITWDLRPDVADNPSTGGDAEPPSKPIAESVLEIRANVATIHLPEKAGNYRIFAYAHDAQGSAATANLPIRVSEKTE